MFSYRNTYTMFHNVSVFVLLALTLVLNSNAYVPITTIDSACFEEAGISENEYRERIPAIKADVNSISGKESCYFLCIGKKAKEVFNNGTLDVDGMRSRIPEMPDEQYQILKNCVNQREVNPCQATKNSILCVKQVMPKIRAKMAEAS
ncbi:uncharacterized protein [Venturia canescens]|uniref:uncharacterized protein isoform X2 n=1 Tax=Venturia canescens TaxID=32260 RepID=UPI001C9CFB84|nr:uncharacterized protein LOC122408397 isoform X2 [Venturia canescens]